MTPRPTLRDVARRAGNLHPSTASRALHNDPAISPETRALVLRAATDLGYHPDPLLDAFNQHRKEVRPQKSEPIIAFVADFDSREALQRSPRDAATFAAAREAAERLHCRVELFLVGPRQLRPERLSQILHTRGIGSVIVGACQDLAQELRLQWELFCCVRIEAQHLPDPKRTVATDLRGAARLATRRLREAGAKRVGLVLNSPRAGADLDLLHAGYLYECGECGVQPAARLLETGHEPASEAALLRWMDSQKLDAVVSDSPDLAPHLRRSGHTFAALDVSTLSEDIAGVVHDHRHIGSVAVEQVVSLARANQRGAGSVPTLTLVPVRWRDGQSVHAPAPAAGTRKPRRRTA